MEEKKAKLVFNAGVVRKLLKAGCRIIDVKADRDNKDKTVFVFERDEAFEKAFSDINEELKKAKEEN
nr:MAG TPA: PLC-X Phosphatidylinositol-specific phospholipase C, X domain [Caudoviricetes sp.]DAT63945.1 MAG TPA: PLC-X Phosphatidylinositol-specific phospholipase C, X domain [Caudoviricetes sp.]